MVTFGNHHRLNNQSSSCCCSAAGSELPLTGSAQSDPATAKPTALSGTTSRPEPKTQALSQTVTLPGDDMDVDESSATSKPAVLSGTTSQSDSQPQSLSQAASNPEDILPTSFEASSRGQSEEEDLGTADMSLSLGTQDSLDQASTAAQDDYTAEAAYTAGADEDFNDQLPATGSASMGTREIDVRTALSDPTAGSMMEAFPGDNPEDDPNDYEQPRSIVLPGAAETLGTVTDADVEATGDPRLQPQSGEPCPEGLCEVQTSSQTTIHFGACQSTYRIRMGLCQA